MSGVYIETCNIGKGIYDFLFFELELDNDFIENKIGTIFMDGMPVDDLFSTKIKHNSRIALSSAMPGLVGAILRRGSPYAIMRENITYKCTQEDCSTNGFVSLKLFNLLIDEIGRKILQKGVFLLASVIRDYILKKELFNYTNSIILNDRQIALKDVLSVLKNIPDSELIAFSLLFFNSQDKMK